MKPPKLRAFPGSRLMVFMAVLLCGMQGILTTATAAPRRFGFTETITITHNFALSDGTQQNTVTVNVNSSGVPVSGIDVTFVINGGASGINPVITTDANGNAILSISSTTAGPVPVEALIGGVPVGTVTVTFVLTAGPPDLTNPNSRLWIDGNFSPADGVSTDNLHAHIEDVNGNPVSGVTVDFAVVGGTAGGTAVLSILSGVTDANGNVAITVTDMVAGTVSINATVGGTTLNNSPGVVTFTAGPPSTSNPATALIIDITGSPADGSTTDQVHAHIVDANGNPVSNATVVFSVTGGTAAGSAVTNGTGITDANGNAILTITNTVAGTVTISALVGGVAINNSPQTVTFVAGPPSTSNPATQLIVDITGSPADGSTIDQVHAHIVDANGNPVQNATVVFTVTGGTAAGTAVTNGTGITNASGDAVLTITNTVAGTVMISATIGGVAINNSPATVTFVAGAPSTSNPATQLIVDVTGSPADGTTTDQVHAHVVDANGNPVQNATVVFTVTGGTASGTAVTNGTGITNANGDAVLTITNTAVGTVIISATIGGVAINNSPVTVTFVAGAPSTSNPATALIIDITGSVADGSTTDQVHAHIVDANGNPVQNATVVFTVTGGTASATAVTNGTGLTNASGDAVLTITDVTAGTVIISATIGGVGINNSPATVTFVAGAIDLSKSIIIIDQNNSPADNNTPDILHAHIVDANGNPINNQTVVFSIVSGTVTFPGPFSVTTNSNGDASVSLISSVAGSVVVSGTVGGTAISNSPVTVNFDNYPDVTKAGTQLVVLIYEATADGSSSTSVQAQIVDQNGNPLPGASVTFSIDSGSAQITGSATLTTDASGYATINLTSTTPGAVLVTATVDGKAILNGSPARVRFAAINIYVPKVFTPNGDGTNDVLKPILVGISSFHYFSVYNRWGNLLFKTEDPNNGWDGNVKGVPQPVETYLWIAEGVDNTGKTIVQKGMVSLVR